MPQELTASERIDALMAIHPKGFDLSLDRIGRLLEKLGNPQDKIPPVIHFTGTNGKGSTIAFTRSILEAAGLSVHVHTSPHLVSWRERYRLGESKGPGRLVEDAVLSDAIRRVADANQGEPITIFEVLSAVMFVLFSEHPADVCLVEVGLGGRFDATNVIKSPAVSVITPVSLDHEAFLGDTIAKIAFEKAGIIKKDASVFSGLQLDDARNVIARQAAKNGSPVSFLGEEFMVGQEDGRMIWQHEAGLLDLPLPKLPGRHQLENAALAVAVSRYFIGEGCSDDTLAQGIESAVWPGRMQPFPDGRLSDVLPENSEVWLDGGHNPDAAGAIADFLGSRQRIDPRPLTLICGMLTTKDPTGYFEAIAPLKPKMITVPLPSSDADFSPEKLAEIAQTIGIEASATSGLTEALGMLDDSAGCRLLFAGSLYLVGDVLRENGTAPD